MTVAVKKINGVARASIKKIENKTIIGGNEIATMPLASDANLQGYWKMEGNWTDSGPNGYNLTGTGTPTDVAAKFGQGRTLVKASSYASLADASCPNLEISGSMTISIWIKPTNIAGSWASGYMVSKRLFTPDRGYYLALADSGSSGGATMPRFHCGGLTTAEDVMAPAYSVANNNWYHIVGVYDSANSKLKVFVNNSKTEVTASGTIRDSNSIFYIGLNSNNTAEGFDGVLDDCAIWNRALTDTEVANIYNTQIKKYTGISNV